MRKQFATALLVPVLAINVVGCGTSAAKTSSSATPSSALQSETLTMYCGTADNKEDITVYYANNDKDILFLDLADGADFLNGIVGSSDSSYHVEVTDDNGKISYTRENGSVAEFDTAEKNLLFYDFDGFFRSSYSTVSVDVLTSSGFDADGQPAYFSREGSNMSFEVKGSPIEIELGKHDIPVYYENGHGYVPLQTFSDVFMVQYYTSILYNGQDLFAVTGTSLPDDLKDLYYSVPTRTSRTETLAAFTYNELALALDLNYGLKSQHNITTFEEYFSTIGLDEELLSEDTGVYTKALATLTNGYFGDGHSAFDVPSFYVGADFDPTSVEDMNTALYDLAVDEIRYSTAREAAFPDGVPAYQEVGNTAYVTFDEFKAADSVGMDYYTTPATIDAPDTMGLIQYANSMIKREGSPIQNIVIDLSNNGGGEADAAIYVIGWYLGTATLNIEDTITGNRSSARYKVDVNGDRVFDENDNVTNYNLYCITSPFSFSCGNLVPATFKNSELVTLLGRSSGGGACVVATLSTADGNLIQISGNKRISTDVNGTYYDIDAGIDVDYTISKPAKFYDREALTNFINTLY